MPQSPSDQRLERGQRTRERLVEEAVRLFALKGFEAVSTRELAGACGVNAAAINFHFGGKAGLYAAVIDRVAVTLTTLYDETVLAASELPAGPAALMAVRGMLARMTEGLLSVDRSRWMSLLIQRELIAPSDAFERIYETALRPVLLALERAVDAVSGAPDGDSPAQAHAASVRTDGRLERTNSSSTQGDDSPGRADAAPTRTDDPAACKDRTKTLSFALFAMIGSFSRSRETYLKWTDKDGYTPKDAAFIGAVLADFAITGLAGATAHNAPRTLPGDRS